MVQRGPEGRAVVLMARRCRSSRRARRRIAQRGCSRKGPLGNRLVDSANHPFAAGFASGMVELSLRPWSPRQRPRVMPRVSVIVSHYDRQALLTEALHSIASQTYRDFEVIVVNDHGADSRVMVDAFAARHPSV